MQLELVQNETNQKMKASCRVGMRREGAGGRGVKVRRRSRRGSVLLSSYRGGAQGGGEDKGGMRREEEEMEVETFSVRNLSLCEPSNQPGV